MCLLFDQCMPEAPCLLGYPHRTSITYRNDGANWPPRVLSRWQAQNNAANVRVRACELAGRNLVTQKPGLVSLQTKPIVAPRR